MGAVYLRQGVGPGTPVHISENHADLVKSLPKNVLTTPFHWDFGDGTVTPGFSAIHSYAHPGVFRVQVYAFYPKQHLWFVFDSARINIVAQTGVLQAVFTVASLEKLIALAAGIFLISLLVRQQRSRRYPPTIAG